MLGGTAYNSNIENRENLEVFLVNKNNSTIVTILMVVGALILGSILLSFLGHFMWVLIKFLIPLAIAVWLVRMITGKTNRRRYY